MASILRNIEKTLVHRDKFYPGTQEEFEHELNNSSTIYVGNINFFTREEQLWEVFSRIAPVKRIIVGLNRYDRTPCGFCFVE
jgi:nuclear cap-binding protein subunit 2